MRALIEDEVAVIEDGTDVPVLTALSVRAELLRFVKAQSKYLTICSNDERLDYRISRPKREEVLADSLCCEEMKLPTVVEENATAVDIICTGCIMQNCRTGLCELTWRNRSP